MKTFTWEVKLIRFNFPQLLHLPFYPKGSLKKKPMSLLFLCYKSSRNYDFSIVFFLFFKMHLIQLIGSKPDIFEGSVKGVTIFRIMYIPV